MIISLHNHPRPPDAADHRPCIGGRGLDCTDDVITAMYRSMGSSDAHRNYTFKFKVTDQTENAVIYVAVVVVFYAAIIIIILGTNGRRGRQRPTSSTKIREFLKRQTLAVYGGHPVGTRVIKTTHKSLKELPTDDPENITPL